MRILATFAVAFSGDVNALEAQLRGGIVPIIGRIHEGKFLLDVRTLFEDDFDLIVEAIETGMGVMTAIGATVLGVAVIFLLTWLIDRKTKRFCLTNA